MVPAPATPRKYAISGKYYSSKLNFEEDFLEISLVVLSNSKEMSSGVSVLSQKNRFFTVSSLKDSRRYYSLR